jgi:collagenase-like PrtC family protease
MSIEEKPEWFYPGIRITSVFDNSPGMIWNGGRVLTGNQLSLSEMKTAVDFYNERKIGVYFTFSNSMLTKEHLEDKFGNQILAAFENPVNGAIVCSELLKEYIHQNYPKYSVTLSVTRCCLEKNKLLELLPLYDMLVIPPEYNHNFNFLQQIPEPQKVELLLNEHCMPYCPRKSRHFELLSKIILGRATSQEINEEKCSYWDITKTEMCIPPEMYPVLTSLGIRHFKLALDT